MAEEWNKQEPASDIWLPTEEGAELIGKVVTVNPEGQYGTQWTIKKEDDTETRTPSHKVLQNRMANVQLNDTIKIVYLGQELPTIKSNNPTRMYDVFVKKPE